MATAVQTNTTRASSAIDVVPQASDRTLAWVKAGLLTLVFVWLFRNNLERLWIKTNWITGDSNWAHSLCIPLIGIYYLFLRRDELVAAKTSPVLPGWWTRGRLIAVGIVALAGGALYLIGPRLPQTETLLLIGGVLNKIGLGLLIYSGLVLLLNWGVATLVAGLMLSAFGIWPGQNDYVWDLGMIITLFGMILTLCGWDVMRIAWFPIAFLVCMLPWPALVYSKVASPLQALAAQVSVLIMQVLGIDASYAGTKIFIPQYTAQGVPLPARALNVAEACAGLVSLMSFISIAAAVAFLSSRPLWQKLVITFSAIPIAIGCNVVRVAGVGMLDIYAGHEWSEGFAHQFAGMVLLLPAFFLIMLVCWIVDQLFIEESDEVTSSPATPVEGTR